MELNRNQYFLIGIVVVLLGIQLRMVDSYVLNAPTTKFVVEKFGSADKQAAVGAATVSLETLGGGGSAPLRSVAPPVWAGWAAISIGAVLILHSLAMPRPG
ncbi:MAG: hypothetical protein WD875_08445 [Pirellulales bacterium]